MQKLRHPKNLLQLANNTKDNRAGEKPYRLSKTGPSPGLSSRPPADQSAQPGVTAIRLLKQAPEPLSNGPWRVMHEASCVQTRPFGHDP